jgi:hypothetical protein
MGKSQHKIKKLQRQFLELPLFFYTLDRKLLRNFINASPIQKSSKLVFCLVDTLSSFHSLLLGHKKTAPNYRDGFFFLWLPDLYPT